MKVLTNALAGGEEEALPVFSHEGRPRCCCVSLKTTRS
jgi:hypothetical protein